MNKVAKVIIYTSNTVLNIRIQLVDGYDITI